MSQDLNCINEPYNNETECRFVLIRHGLTYWNEKKKMQGQVNIPLSPAGENQARELANRMKDYHFDACLCSPLIRAIQTTKIVLGDSELPIQTKELLIEQSYGLCEGQWQPLVYRLPIFRMYHYPRSPEKYIPAVGGESMADMLSRADRVMNEVFIPEAEKHHTVLVGAHGCIICAILDRIEGIGPQHFWQNKLKNCGFAVIEYHNHTWKILEKN